MKTLLISEGSGGHLVPALELASTLAASGSEVHLWYARRKRIQRLVDPLLKPAEAHGVRVEPIDITHSGKSLERIKEGLAFVGRSRRFMQAFRPDVVIGFGGWVSAPVLLAARSLGIRTLLHEQNRIMGRTNRILARFANGVALSFPDTRKVPFGARTVVSGMPVRRAFLDAATAEPQPERFGLIRERTTIAVLGGSQGAQAINRLMMEAAQRMTTEEKMAWQILHIAGPEAAKVARDHYAECGVRSWVGTFCEEMDAVYAMADVVVSRAGASTLAELMASGKPAILVPYPFAHGHQSVNAAWLSERDLAVVRAESGITPETLLEDLRTLIQNPERRRRMQEALLRGVPRNAAERLALTARSMASGQWPTFRETWKEESNREEDRFSHDRRIVAADAH